MKLKNKLYAAAAAVAIVAAAIWSFAPKPVEVETATATQGRFELAVEEDGKTRLRDRYVISAPVAGRLSRLTLKQGDAVQAGTAVAVLYPNAPTLLDARTEDAQRARVEEMQALLSRADVEVERARAARDQAQNDLKRVEELARQNYVSPTRAEAERLALRVAQAALESARRQRDASLHGLQQARAALEQYRPGQEGAAAGRAWTLHAPVSGRVVKVLQESEAAVQPGAPILELGDPGRLEVVSTILTTDAAPLRPGAPVVLTGWGGAPLEGRLRYVEPGGFTKVSALGVEEQRVNAVIDIVSPPERWQGLGDGFQVDVRILSQVVPQAVKVPLGAVFQRQNQSEVFVLKNGRAERRRVVVGARNGLEAWIRDGLAPGTEVLVYPSDAVTDGTRVRKRKLGSE